MARSGCSLTSTPNGIFCFGGINPSGQIETSIEVYKFGVDKWTKVEILNPSAWKPLSLAGVV